MRSIAFDEEKYIRIQSEKIMERVNMFNNKLYLEFGGKLFDDGHASRVLPGFEPDVKVKMLKNISSEAEIVIAINANDIEKNKTRGDSGITYAQEVLRLIDAFRGIGLYVGSVVITQYSNQAAADKFRSQLTELEIKTFLHYPIEGYPTNIDLIISDEGYGKNEYIETSRPLVVMTAPGPGSGKMATCLSQIYHDHKKGIASGYAKFETFPIWNLPLKHPVNIAYEAATVDLDDVNMIDPFHLEAYGIQTVNYNRDIEIFPVLNRMMSKIMDESPYKSPTDMGVNMIGYCIINDEAARKASYDEVIRRYYKALVDRRQGDASDELVRRMETLMSQADIDINQRAVIAAALKKAEDTQSPAVAIELNDGQMITGKTSSLFGASAAAIINALKVLANIDDDIMLISPFIIEPVQSLKTEMLGNSNPRLHIDEMLIALSISARMNPAAEKALSVIPQLKYCQAHSSVILSSGDQDLFKKLGMNLTMEPVYKTKKLFHNK